MRRAVGVGLLAVAVVGGWWIAAIDRMAQDVLRGGDE